jgi:hypothetical protein
VWASLLLVWFSFALIGPVPFANARPDLPACCKREGKHHCSVVQGSVSGLKALPEKCPSYPVSLALPAHEKISVQDRSAQVRELAVVCPVAAEVIRVSYRHPFDNSCQKRGPPALAS